MSEYINNREVIDKDLEFRRNKLKQLILELHEGRDFEEVKKEFQTVFGSISAAEISQLEQSIIAEGMPVSEVQRLCDVHSAVFKGSIDEIHGLKGPKGIEGHPINTFLKENEAIKNFLNVKFKFNVDMFKDNASDDRREKLLKNVEILYTIDNHYSRKENLLFPYLEKYGVYGPAKVMWGVDDEIRGDLKSVMQGLRNDEDQDSIVQKIDTVVHKLNEMFFKEEHILLPLAEEKLTEDEWVEIANESHDIGFTLIEAPKPWIPEKADKHVDEILKSKEQIVDGFVRFETGVIKLKELELMLNTLPVDMTFIDKDDVVRYFSHGAERIFTRTKAVIGRTVQNCHPPGSVHIVDKLLADFKSGAKDSEDFWINMGPMFVLIRYFAIRDEENNYLGTLEFTQNIKPLQEITGEKRLLSEE